MKIESIRSQNTVVLQQPVSIPCSNWQVDEPKAVRIRHQPASLPSVIQYVAQNDNYRLLEAHLEKFAINFDPNHKKGFFIC